ncbi:MAG: winged helix DNA-binding protein [Sphingomonadaceae bacterium]
MVDFGESLSALLAHDGDQAEGRGREALRRAGIRVSQTIDLAASQGFEPMQAPAIVVAELGEDVGRSRPFLESIEMGLASGYFEAVIASPLSAVDALAAHSLAPEIWQIVGEDIGERVAAIQAACALRKARLSDVGAEGNTAELQQLSEEVGRIANMLASLSEDVQTKALDSQEQAEKESPLTASRIRAMIRARRLREQYFTSGLFADPAWDMLLDLFAARLEKKRVAVSSLCIAAAVPPTTALRWIKTLTDHGLFRRVADPQDGRRVFIELSDDAAARLERYLKMVQRLAPLAI